MSKYIDTEKLIAEIERRIDSWTICGEHSPAGQGKGTCESRVTELSDLLSFITSLQQEQPIKVYRVENEKEQKGLWRKFDGTWEPLFDMLTDGQCKDMPMEDSPIYREGGKQWFASAPSRETLQKWFSKRDLEELTAKGFTISEFEVVEHKKVSNFEYIFTRDSIISRTYLKVSDIYPQEQPRCVEKTARISPGMISNFGTSTYVLDVDLTQDEMEKIAPFGFNSDKLKIKIVCE